VRAVLLILGLSLMTATGLALAQEGVPLAMPGAAPDPLLPLPQLPGAPPVSEVTPPGRPERMVPVTPQHAAAPPKQPEAAPPRPPAFRILTPREPEQLVGKDSGNPNPFGLTPPQGQPTKSERVRPPVVEPPPGAPPTFKGAQTPALALEKIGPASAQAGQSFAYEIVLRNVGSTTAQRVRVDDELPPGTQFVHAVPVPVSAPDRLTWTVDDLAPGAEQHFRVVVLPSSGGEWQGSATVTVSAAQALRTHVNGPVLNGPAQAAGGQQVGVSGPLLNAAPPAAGGGLQLALKAPTGVVAGHPVVFDLRVTNAGAAAVAGAVLQAHLPPGLDHVYGGDIELPLEPLKAGETRNFPLDAIAAQPGSHEVEVVVKVAAAAQTVGRAAVVVTEDPVLGLRLVEPKEAWTDRENEYRIEVTNRGRDALRDVSLMDRLPEGVAIVGGVAGGAYDARTRSVRWDLGPLGAGQTRILSLKLLSRVGGPVLNEITARTDQGHQARRQTVLRFQVARPGPPPGRMQTFGAG
jgi:uncharacterized repeat protein (TIGR01451 family)